MAMIQFTRNYHDRSNDYGFQFEFFCDKCNTGCMSPFITSKVGLASGLLRAVGSFHGGPLSRAAYAGSHVKDALRGQAWDEAYAEAVDVVRKHFRHCTRCGKWVCPRSCWNEQRGLCEGCTPDQAEEVAHGQAPVAVERAWDKAHQVDPVAELGMQAPRLTSCPHCQAHIHGGKFCSECGKPLSGRTCCGQCGEEMGPRAKFCSECGAPRAT